MTGLRGLATFVISSYRVTSPNNHHGITPSKFGYGSSIHQGRSISMKSPDSITNTIREQEDFNVQTSDPPSPRPTFFSWVKWVLGSIVPFLFSFWSRKWDNMLKLEGKVEKVVEEAEEMAKVVEKVATTTEKLSAEVAEKLDNGELKEAALMVEHVSSLTAKDAQITQDFIHKVAHLKQDLKDLETMVEPVIDKIEHRK